MAVLDPAAGDGGEQPSSQTQQASPSAFRVLLPPGFPPFPPARGFSFQPQVPRRAARENPLSAHFPFQLSCLVLPASRLPPPDRSAALPDHELPHLGLLHAPLSLCRFFPLCYWEFLHFRRCGG